MRPASIVGVEWEKEAYFARDIRNEAQVDGAAADVGRVQAEAIL